MSDRQYLEPLEPRRHLSVTLKDADLIVTGHARHDTTIRVVMTQQERERLVSVLVRSDKRTERQVFNRNEIRRFIVVGRDGDDTIIIKQLDERRPIPAEIRGNAGDDTVRGSLGFDVISGGEGNDNLAGSDGEDTLLGGAGDDTLFGGDDNDVLFGGTGNDRLLGGDDLDALYGQAGRDTLLGGDHRDGLFGMAGRDVLDGQQDDDLVYGGGGRDSVRRSDGRDRNHAGDLEDMTEYFRTVAQLELPRHLVDEVLD